MMFPRVVLLVSACVFAFFGAWAVMFPISQVSLVEVGVPTATARADVRTQYGGFTLGFAVFLYVCFVRREWTAVGLLASACALSGFALTRTLRAPRRTRFADDLLSGARGGFRRDSVSGRVVGREAHVGQASSLSVLRRDRLEACLSYEETGWKPVCPTKRQAGSL
ncbi:MAG: DUF4345 domain-containing protein, partial [Planctomycetia bacterium]|nr:DUF4345 domain-containing protein [Planctomycetia bacterium]